MRLLLTLFCSFASHCPSPLLSHTRSPTPATPEVTQAELEKEVMHPAKTLQGDDNDSGCGPLCPSGTTYPGETTGSFCGSDSDKNANEAAEIIERIHDVFDAVETLVSLILTSSSDSSTYTITVPVAVMVMAGSILRIKLSVGKRAVFAMGSGAVVRIGLRRGHWGCLMGS